MRNCLVLGSGRSGTSMVTGTLAQAGYAMGDQLYRPRTANPKGFFEDPEINGINEALLAGAVPASSGLGENQRWLAALPVDTEIRAAGALEARIRRATARRPYCYKDPRFAFTLPAWRPFLEDFGLVCVFRHPLATAGSMVKEVGTAAYLRGVPFDLGRALELWAAIYRSVLRRHARRDSWLFLHYDQALTPEGVGRLGRFLDAPVDADFPDALMRRSTPEGELPAEVSELYAELCERAGFAAEVAAPSAGPALPEITTLVVVGPDSPPGELPARFADQRGVVAELLVVDTRDTPAEVPGARVLHVPTWSRGVALAAGAAAARGRYVAVWRPDVHALPSQLAHAVRALDAAPEAGAVRVAGWLSEPPESFVATIPAEGTAPGTGAWRGATIWRREVLAEVGAEAFHPVERLLLDQLAAAGRLARVDAPLFHVDRRDAERLDAADLVELDLLDTAARGGPVDLSVLLCTYDRKDVLRRTLEGFCTQGLPEGRYELVVVDDGSRDGTDRALEGLRFGVPVTVIRRPNGGLAAARNTAIAAARGRLLHLVNDDTLPHPGCLAAHVAGHAAFDHPVAVLGSFVQPPTALSNALMRVCETGRFVFCYADLTAGQFHRSIYFYTCNVSAPAEAVRAAGGFDEAFRHYGGEDTDLGLRLGLPVLYLPEAGATHLHTWGWDYLARRTPMVARAHVRLYLKHAELLEGWNVPDHEVPALEATLAMRAGVDGVLDRAGASLAGLDLGAVEALGDAWRPYVAESQRRLVAVLTERHRGWWAEGLLAGLREHGLDGFPALAARHPVELGLSGEVWIAVPGPDTDWKGLARRFAAARRPDTTLVLVSGEVPLAELDAVSARLRGVEALDWPHGPGHHVRLLVGATGWVPCGGSGDARLRRLATRFGVPERGMDAVRAVA